MTNTAIKIAHLSDLHFGAASPDAVSALHADLAQRQPEFVIITGDLTQEGRKKEFEEARDFLAAIKATLFIVPGNHDLPVRNLWARFISPYSRFQRFIANATNPVYADGRIALAGLNSARRAALDINWSYGRLSRRQIRDAACHFGHAEPSTIKIVAAHHPFIKGAGKAGARIVTRGEEALQEFSKNRVDIILTGHVHQSGAIEVAAGSRNIVIIQAGTATSTRTRDEKPSYNLITADMNRINVQTITLQKGSFSPVNTADFARHDSAGWVRDKSAGAL